MDKFSGLPLYYIVPPEAFAAKSDGGKLVLSEVSLIVDPAPYGGWESLGFIVITADGVDGVSVTYKGWAADVFRPGGTLKSIDGTKTLVMPTSDKVIFKPDDNGGNYGFAGFPLVIAEKNLSFAFTGSPSGGPPPRIYFGVRVDEFDPKISVKTTAQMTNQELTELAAAYDRHLTGIDRTAEIAKLEENAAVNYPEIGLKPKEEATFEFTTKPGSLLSSVHVYMWPQNNNQDKSILEINPDILIDGQLMYSGTGFEDFGGEAFYSSGHNPLGAFFPIDHDGYLAKRYFLAVIPDGKVVVRLKNPDVGTTINLRVEVKVIDPDLTLFPK